ncbi:hypothetical protein [Bradymonas sediminis]|nr:hypothetical protein [Bradymonas sediminis]TDP73918.1 hypothetical protein DFR33_105252 [Bradymonas sediminis]
MKTRQMNDEIAADARASAPERGRSRLSLVFLIGFLALSLGCDAKPKGESAGQAKVEQKAEPAAEEPSSEAVLVEAGPIKITLKDFEYALHLKRFVASMDQLEPPKDYLAARPAQMELLEHLIMDSVVAHEVAQRALTISVEEKVAALRSEPGVARFASILESPASADPAADAVLRDALRELEARGLTRADVDYVAGVIAGEAKLRDVFLSEVREDAVWQYYAMKNDRARVLAIAMSNSPTMGEVMSVVESEPERIEAYFEEHKLRWKPKDGPVPQLDDGLRRQIAGILLAEASVIPSVYNKMMVEIKALQAAKKLPAAGRSKASKAARERAIEALAKKFEKPGVTVHVTPVFSQENPGFIPEIGLSEEFARAIFATELSEPVSPKPVLSRQKAWAFLLLEREHPSREEFEAQKDAVRAEYLEKLKDVIVPGYVQGFFGAHNPDFNFEPLKKAYGDAAPAAPKDDPGE